MSPTQKTKANLLSEKKSLNDAKILKNTPILKFLVEPRN